jgi:phospholipid N-methyltransferase
MEYLKNRFKQDPRFVTQAGVTVNFITADVRQLDPAKTYDYIIFSLPLTNFPSPMVEEILTLMMARLKPGGIFSYVHYIFFGRLKYLSSSSAGKATIRRNQAIIKRFADQYQIERRAVLANVPPSWVYYWQKPG